MAANVRTGGALHFLFDQPPPPPPPWPTSRKAEQRRMAQRRLKEAAKRKDRAKRKKEEKLAATREETEKIELEVFWKKQRLRRSIEIGVAITRAKISKEARAASVIWKAWRVDGGRERHSHACAVQLSEELRRMWAAKVIGTAWSQCEAARVRAYAKERLNGKMGPIRKRRAELARCSDAGVEERNGPTEEELEKEREERVMQEWRYQRGREHYENMAKAKAGGVGAYGNPDETRLDDIMINKIREFWREQEEKKAAAAAAHAKAQAEREAAIAAREADEAARKAEQAAIRKTIEDNLLKKMADLALRIKKAEAEMAEMAKREAEQVAAEAERVARREERAIIRATLENLLVKRVADMIKRAQEADVAARDAERAATRETIAAHLNKMVARTLRNVKEEGERVARKAERSAIRATVAGQVSKMVVRMLNNAAEEARLAQEAKRAAIRAAIMDHIPTMLARIRAKSEEAESSAKQEARIAATRDIINNHLLVRVAEMLRRKQESGKDRGPRQASLVRFSSSTVNSPSLRKHAAGPPQGLLPHPAQVIRHMETF
eukprot:jgi/Undpi1/2882/HiC_scaffold_14.g06259.m1